MVYPVFIYGSPVLRKRAEKIDENFEELPQLISDMFETMYKSDGLGLAARQIGKSIRLFIIDAKPLEEEDPSLIGFKKVFINPEILEKNGDVYTYNEGCLSIPEIREDVMRPESILIKYYDENFNLYEEEFTGMKARIIQHEYDHLDGILFIDKIAPIRKKILKSKLLAISKGKFEQKYTCHRLNRPEP